MLNSTTVLNAEPTKDESATNHAAPAAAATPAGAAPASSTGAATVTFTSLGLSQPLLRDLAAAKFTEPTPIQAQAIPHGLQGKDILGCAQTGTGKTAAFVIPMIERLASGPVGHPKGLILAPTRELAYQIQKTIALLGRSRRVSATTVIGGEDIRVQVRGLQQRPTIVVATPGRLLDHMWNGTIKLDEFTIVVLDEADRMLDMGFAPQLNQILDALQPERQTMLFSATMPADLADLARAGLREPIRIMVNPPAQAARTVTHEVHHTTRDEKTGLLLKMLEETSGTILVFTRTKHGADKVGRVLEQKGHRVGVLHAGRRLSQRKTALEGFRRGSFRVLVATDIAARGIDVANIGHVVNFDLPNTPEDYVHRIGRTGRMKTEGRATSFVTGEDHFQLRAIERLLGHPVPRAKGSPEPARFSGGGPARSGRPFQGGPRPGGDQRRPFARPGYQGHRPGGAPMGASPEGRPAMPRRDDMPREVDGNRRDAVYGQGARYGRPDGAPRQQPQGGYGQDPQARPSAPRPRRWVRTPQS
ncbi:MAG: DEAD/DEAH box helicase [Nitrospiraceae bacterium]